MKSRHDSARRSQRSPTDEFGDGNWTLRRPHAQHPRPLSRPRPTAVLLAPWPMSLAPESSLQSVHHKLQGGHHGCAGRSRSNHHRSRSRHRARARAALRPRGRQGRRERPRWRDWTDRVTPPRRPKRSSPRSTRWAARPSRTTTTSPTGRAVSASSRAPSTPSATLHVLVNNAGILRDRVLVNLSEEDWDSVINVHLKGHFVPVASRRELLARGGQGRSSRQGLDHQHLLDVGSARQHRSVELRRREGRYRGLHRDHRRGAESLRRARERDRARRANSNDRIDAGPVRLRRGAARRVGL